MVLWDNLHIEKKIDKGNNRNNFLVLPRFLTLINLYKSIKMKK